MISGAHFISFFAKPAAYFVALLGLAALAWAALDWSDPVIFPRKTAAQPVPKRPMRVVSLNLCTDQLLMQLADHDRIAGLSHLARDEDMSAMSELAHTLPVTRSTAEEVIAIDPDLIVAGAFSTRETVSILKRLGYRVVDFDPASDFESIKANIGKMAEALGDEARGRRAIAKIDHGLKRAQSGLGYWPLFANLEANGFTSGKGALITSMASAAGFRVLGEELGIFGTRQISFEQLLVSRPEMIGISTGSQAPALASEVFSHPVFSAIELRSDSVEIPVKYTSCGTLSVLDGLSLLADARRGMGERLGAY